MRNSFQYIQNNLTLNHRVEIVENKLFVKTRHNTLSIIDFEWKIMV